MECLYKVRHSSNLSSSSSSVQVLPAIMVGLFLQNCSIIGIGSKLPAMLITRSKRVSPLTITCWVYPILCNRFAEASFCTNKKEKKDSIFLLTPPYHLKNNWSFLK